MFEFCCCSMIPVWAYYDFIASLALNSAILEQKSRMQITWATAGTITYTPHNWTYKMWQRHNAASILLSARHRLQTAAKALGSMSAGRAGTSHWSSNESYVSMKGAYVVILVCSPPTTYTCMQYTIASTHLLLHQNMPQKLNIQKGTNDVILLCWSGFMHLVVRLQALCFYVSWNANMVGNT